MTGLPQIRLQLRTEVDFVLKLQNRGKDINSANPPNITGGGERILVESLQPAFLLTQQFGWVWNFKWYSKT